MGPPMCFALEDPKDYYSTLRISGIQAKIQHTSTHLGGAIPVKTKLEAVLYLLATGCNLKTLTHPFRLRKSTVCEFFQEVCEAILKH
ncbi:hypothetical protein PR048_017389 [Dryococelus australis]|uniref:Uncharacterized protein n=1 Tax=Dryococelus australis TaxID=614101 RepID=A0ABQ9H9I9_9NEOP|nr:hypothetical protein PR048_017389 [Dryococelus australis]